MSEISDFDDSFFDEDYVPPQPVIEKAEDVPVTEVITQITENQNNTTMSIDFFRSRAASLEREIKSGSIVSEEEVVFHPKNDAGFIVEGGDERVIDCTKKFVETIGELIKSVDEEIKIQAEGTTYETRKKLRKYSAKPEFFHKKYTSPKKPMKFRTKVFITIGICLLIGMFMGIKAVSYYSSMRGNVNSNLGCAFLWLIDDSSLDFSMFNIDVFATAFFVWFFMSGIAAVLIWNSLDEKKKSRVGHEHGASRFANASDFKKFKDQMMD